MIGPVPTLAIAAFVERHDAVSSTDILFHFGIGESTLRRRRPALRRLGIEFVENGRWSFYARADLLARLPATRLPLTDHMRHTETLSARAHAREAKAPDSAHDRTLSARVGARAREADEVAQEAPATPRNEEEPPTMDNVIQITSVVRVEPGALLKIPTRESVAEPDGSGAMRYSFVDGETALDLNGVSGLELASEKLTVSYRAGETNTFELVEGSAIEVGGQAVPVGNLVGLVLEPAAD